MVKVSKDQIEEKAKMKIEAADPVLQWIIRWAAMVYTRFKIGASGRQNGL